MAVPFLLHWKPSGAAPVTSTEKLAVFPAVTAVLAGCPMICGAAGVGEVVITAGWMV